MVNYMSLFFCDHNRADLIVDCHAHDDGLMRATKVTNINYNVVPFVLRSFTLPGN